jgi:prolyl oligopeptidase
MADVVRGDWSKLVALFTPTATASLTSTTGTKDFLIIKILQDVLPVLKFWRYSAGVWQEVTSQDAQSGVPVGQDVCISAISPDDSNDVWLQRDGYLVPDNLELGTAEDNCSTTSVLKTKPAMFDASSLTVDQHFAVSNDGTRIPYFVQRRSDLKLDGSNATLLDAYGGFEISRLPYYSAVHGSSWLERGGVRVVANIRGGGEYGPMWHQSALKENRQRCYEDMESVAADLIARGITCQNKLACIGGSNGGLLIGNMITRERACSLFGAAVCQVPLLDMKRYSKLLAGASWMAEYGDPDTDDWKFIRGFSSYQVLRHDCLGLPEEGQPRTPNTQWRCPKVLFTTSTRDDRVHPGHARKMVKALVDEATREQAPTVLYWENIEGGHGGAADNTQAAYMWALTYEFVSQSLGLGSPDQSAL